MINPEQLVFTVIKPAMQALGLFGFPSCALVAGTAAAESGCGEYLVQSYYKPGDDLKTFKGGLGLFQMQADDHDDIVKNYFPGDPTIAGKMHALFGGFDAQRLISDMVYAASFCRIHYLRQKDPIPYATNVLGLAGYWKTYYNSSLGAGDADYFMTRFKLVQPAITKLIAMG